MKKLLLLSLLVLGAKSFAAVNVVGNKDAGVKMPIVVKGEVVEAASTDLVIESDTVGMDGNKMLFAFQQIAKSGTAGVKGTFVVRMGDNSALPTIGSGSSELQIGLGDSFATEDSATVLTNTTINYALSGSLENANKYNGILDVTINAGSNTGTFQEDTKFIHAKVKA